ncbi:heterokaryon incompatibility, partial [Lineolata rhizophorae]
YTALSYAWGDPNSTKKIIMNGVEVSVGANLEAALRTLRKRPEFVNGLKLWANALCINQTDLDEKENAVSRMLSVYQIASSVTIWLGPGNTESATTVSTIQDFLAGRSDDWESASTEEYRTELFRLYFATQILPAIIDLMDRAYWKRLWVMQEIS